MQTPIQRNLSHTAEGKTEETFIVKKKNQVEFIQKHPYPHPTSLPTHSKQRPQYQLPVLSHHKSLPPHKQQNLSTSATSLIKTSYLVLCSSLVIVWSSVSETPRLINMFSRGMLRVTLLFLLEGAIGTVGMGMLGGGVG
jgi:hypothetical protein